MPHRLRRGALYEEALKQEKRVPNGYTHAMIFNTAGEIVRREVPGHTTYAEANGFWRTGSFAPFKSSLDRAWLPWLEGRASFEATLQALVAAMP